MQFLGKFNNQEVLAKILIYRSPYDRPPLKRWGILCHFYDSSQTGESLSGLDNSRGKGFHIFPSSHDILPEDQCAVKAIEFLERLGFTEWENIPLKS